MQIDVAMTEVLGAGCSTQPIRSRCKRRGSAAGFGLASGGHRLDAYRRLPTGWNPAPPGINSDLHFWLQFLEQPWCRYVSSKWPRVVHLSSVTRKQWDLPRRVDELAAIWDRIQAPAQREALARECLLPLHDKLVRDAFASTSGAGLAWEIGRLSKALGRTLWSRARKYVSRIR